jgi:hypothetical protein
MNSIAGKSACYPIGRNGSPISKSSQVSRPVASMATATRGGRARRIEARQSPIRRGSDHLDNEDRYATVHSKAAFRLPTSGAPLGIKCPTQDRNRLIRLNYFLDRLSEFSTSYS